MKTEIAEQIKTATREAAREGKLIGGTFYGDRVGTGCAIGQWLMRCCNLPTFQAYTDDCQHQAKGPIRRAGIAGYEQDQIEFANDNSLTDGLSQWETYLAVEKVIDAMDKT